MASTIQFSFRFDESIVKQRDRKVEYKTRSLDTQ